MTESEYLEDALRRAAERIQKLRREVPSDMQWRSCKLQAPPPYVEVLVWYGGELRFAHYRHNDAESRGPGHTLPNDSCTSRWSLGNYEGPFTIEWWMPLPGAP